MYTNELLFSVKTIIICLTQEAPLMALKQESKKQSVFLKIKVYPDCCVEDRVAKRDH